MNQTKTIPIPQLMPDADAQYIEDMAGFYGITREEAFARYLAGNIEGIVYDPLDDELEEF